MAQTISGPGNHSKQLVDQVQSVWKSDLWRSTHVLVALSGGPDSMALLRTLRHLESSVSGVGRIFAGHVNHGLREEADADQQWLQAECRRLDVELLFQRGDAEGALREDGDGLEAAARRIRYRLLTEMAESVGARFVATGHTYDDQVETVLFRMLRGTGVRGLAGVPFARALSPSVTLVRPFLNVHRSTIEASLQEMRQAVRRDASNQDSQHTRNRLRLELLPQLRQQFNSDVDDALWRLSQQANELSELVDSLASAILSQCQPTIRHGKGFSIDVRPLAMERPYLVRESLRFAWRRCGLPEQAMNFASWQRLAALATGCDEATTFELPAGVVATLADGVLTVQRAPS